MKTITVKDNTHSILWMFKIKSKAKDLDAVIKIMIKCWRENNKPVRLYTQRGEEIK